MRISDEFWTNCLIRRLEAEGLEVPPFEKSYKQLGTGPCIYIGTKVLNPHNRGLVICTYIPSIDCLLEEPSYTDIGRAVKENLLDEVHVYVLPRAKINNEILMIRIDSYVRIASYTNY